MTGTEGRGPDLAALMAAALADHRAGRLQAAERGYRQVLAAAPGHLGAVFNLAVALEQLGRPAEAEAGYRHGLSLAPGQAFGLQRLRGLLGRQGRNAELLTLADEVAASGGDPGEAALARATALAGLGRDGEAVEAFQAAQAAGADAFQTLVGLGLSCSSLGRYEDALAAFDEALALRPGDPEVLNRRAPTRLRIGDFAGGWADYEARWRTPGFLAGPGAWASQALSRLLVDPRREQVVGRHILAVAEQGIGDQVMFASLLPDLLRDAARVTCVADARLVRLFSASFPTVEVLPASATPLSCEGYDAVVAMGSLGRLYRNRREDFPGTPYLSPSEAVRARWAERLGPRPGGLRVGLSWRGGTVATRRSERSIPLERFRPLLTLPGCEVVSLQYGDVGEEVAAVNAGLERPIRLFPPAEIDDLEELAGLVSQLDVVVSVQTALVHLAGATGAQALVLAPRHAEWRYGAEGPDMAWYRSVRLFRQGDDRDWAAVVGQVAEAVGARLPSS